MNDPKPNATTKIEFSPLMKTLIVVDRDCSDAEAWQRMDELKRWKERKLRDRISHVEKLAKTLAVLAGTFLATTLLGVAIIWKLMS